MSLTLFPLRPPAIPYSTHQRSPTDTLSSRPGGSYLRSPTMNRPARIETTFRGRDGKLPRDPSNWVDRDLSFFVQSQFSPGEANGLTQFISRHRLNPRALWYLQAEPDALHALLPDASLHHLLLSLAQSVQPAVSPTTPRIRHVRRLSEDLARPPPPPPSPPAIEPELEEMTEQDDDDAKSIVSAWELEGDVGPDAAADRDAAPEPTAAPDGGALGLHLNEDAPSQVTPEEDLIDFHEEEATTQPVFEAAPVSRLPAARAHAGPEGADLPVAEVYPVAGESTSSPSHVHDVTGESPAEDLPKDEPFAHADADEAAAFASNSDHGDNADPIHESKPESSEDVSTPDRGGDLDDEVEVKATEHEIDASESPSYEEGTTPEVRNREDTTEVGDDEQHQRHDEHAETAEAAEMKHQQQDDVKPEAPVDSRSGEPKEESESSTLALSALNTDTGDDKLQCAPQNQLEEHLQSGDVPPADGTVSPKLTEERDRVTKDTKEQDSTTKEGSASLSVEAVEVVDSAKSAESPQSPQSGRASQTFLQGECSEQEGTGSDATLNANSGLSEDTIGPGEAITPPAIHTEDIDIHVDNVQPNAGNVRQSDQQDVDKQDANVGTINQGETSPALTPAPVNESAMEDNHRPEDGERTSDSPMKTAIDTQHEEGSLVATELLHTQNSTETVPSPSLGEDSSPSLQKDRLTDTSTQQPDNKGEKSSTTSASGASSTPQVANGENADNRPDVSADPERERLTENVEFGAMNSPVQNSDSNAPRQTNSNPADDHQHHHFNIPSASSSSAQETASNRRAASPPPLNTTISPRHTTRNPRGNSSHLRQSGRTRMPPVTPQSPAWGAASTAKKFLSTTFGSFSSAITSVSSSPTRNTSQERQTAITEPSTPPALCSTATKSAWEPGKKICSSVAAPKQDCSPEAQAKTTSPPLELSAIVPEQTGTPSSENGKSAVEKNFPEVLSANAHGQGGLPGIQSDANGGGREEIRSGEQGTSATAVPKPKNLERPENVERVDMEIKDVEVIVESEVISEDGKREGGAAGQPDVGEPLSTHCDSQEVGDEEGDEDEGEDLQHWMKVPKTRHNAVVAMTSDGKQSDAEDDAEERQQSPPPSPKPKGNTSRGKSQLQALRVQELAGSDGETSSPTTPSDAFGNDLTELDNTSSPAESRRKKKKKKKKSTPS